MYIDSHMLVVYKFQNLRKDPRNMKVIDKQDVVNMHHN